MNKLISTISVPIIMFVIVAVSYVSAWSATYYVDATNGNDNNSGTLISTPWKTISKVNVTKFTPGDQILLKRGATWREQLIVPSSGTPGNPITFDAYGTGNPPKILGSVNKSITSDWVLDTGNNWKTAATIPGDVGNIIFNNETSTGIKVNTEAELTSQGKFWYDSTNHKVKLYSISNPATFYSNIEIAYSHGASGLLRLPNLDSISIRNLDFRYSSDFGIVAAGTSNILIEYCNFKYIGGGYQTGTSRFGNGIEFWDSNHDTTVRYCRLDQIYDAALTTQGTTPGNKKYNQYFYYNIISNSEYSFEFWNRDATSTTDNITFDNNTCVNAGGGFGHSQRPDPLGVHLMLYSNTAATTNVYFRNNIFYSATDYLVDVTTLNSTLNGITIDYNDYYKASGNMLQWGNGAKYTVSQFSNYKTASGKDAHSMAPVNPQFKNFAGNDFSLSSSSPCIKSGIYVGLTHDFFGNTLVAGLPVDIGAEKYTLLSPPTNLVLLK